MLYINASAIMSHHSNRSNCALSTARTLKRLNENSDSEILIFIEGVTHVVPENHFNDFPGPFDNFQAVKIINW